VRALLRDGALSAGHARALLGLEDDRRMAEMAQHAVDEGWSVRNVEAQVKRDRRQKPTPGRERSREAGERALEEALQRVLGTDVRIRQGRGSKGRIEIPFYGAEDFERIFELLSGESATDVVS
jgi:ParB family transcriptional regulator, chromosome partitioning protein